MADQQFIDALHEQDKIDQLVVDLDLAQYDNVVLSVNNKTGAVVLVTTDIAEGTNLYYTNTRADERVALLIDDALTNLTKAWSSQKITDAISLGVVASAAKWTNVMNFDFGGDLVGNGGFDGSSTATFSATVPGKVDNARVLTDVPAGALFTDTAYDDTTIWAAVNLNTAKTGITASQASEIEANNAKNSYPTEDQTKLLTVETGAEVNVQADCAETDELLDSFIQNKPTTGYKNYLINGAMGIWQRGDSGGTGSGFVADRWNCIDGGNSITVNRMNGSVKDFLGLTIIDNTSASNIILKQKIEDSRTLSGKNCVVSFYTEGSTIGSVDVSLKQFFDSTDTPIDIPPVTLDISGQGYFEAAFILPSTSGKLRGGNSCLQVLFNLGVQEGDFNITEVQLEEGIRRTNFEHRASGIELTLCQRYFEKSYEDGYAYTDLVTYADMGIYPPRVGQRSVSGTFRTTKRVAPSLSFATITGSERYEDTIRDGMSGLMLPAAVGYLTSTGFILTTTEDCPLESGYVQMFWIADAEI